MPGGTTRLRRELAVGVLGTMLLFVPLAGAAAGAQQDGADVQQNGGAGVTESEALSAAEAAEPDPGGKRMTATRAHGAVMIDGRVDEPVWNDAEVVSDFLQREPDNAQPGSERTEVRVLYDEEYLYFGFKLYDRQPHEIVATDLRRDSRMREDDTIAVLLDTFHDHRNGFLFRLNPLGTKYDAQLRNEREVNSDWDEKWEGASQITPQGWEAEMAIPWKALRFPAGTHIWGIDFKRELTRRREEMNWSNYVRGYQFNSISQGGHLLGLQSLKLTDRFRVKPYATGGINQFNQTAAPFSEGTGDLGIEDFKVQITPNMTADFTFNTDFAQVEDDNERVNLTRFSLFFPEKREFFLESGNNFSFGAGGGPGMGGGFGGPDVSLFHSRNIGLAGGQPIPILYGAKMTGKLGSSNLGMLNVQTGDSEHGPGENFTALRIKQDVFGRSTIGAIFTNVQGGGDHNRVLGVDANFRFLEYLNFGGFVARLDDADVAGNPYVGRFNGGWNSDRFDLSGEYTIIQPGFDSELGFIQRADIEKQEYRAGWSPRPGWDLVRQFRFNASVNYIADTAGTLESRDQNLSANVQFESGDNVTLRYGRNFERLERSFFVSGIAEVPVGDYDWEDYSVSLNTFSARRLSGRFNYSWGGFYNGTRRSMGPGGSIRFSEKFSLSPSWSWNRVELPTGEFSTHTVSLRSEYNFNDRWLTNSLLQYNSVSEQVSVFARLNYIYRDGDDFFLVYKQTRRVDGTFAGESDRSLTAKLTYSFDF